MTEIEVSRLIGLLIELRETLDVEHKGWLCLSEKPAKAKLAKAAIALANSGGGLIVLGTTEDNENDKQLTSLPRPSEMGRYDVNEINAAITRYAEPQFHCDLRFAVHPDTHVEHAFVIVPGDIAVPVMATRDCVDENGKVILKQRRCYIRKAGPKSEEPHTSEDWRRLFEKCIDADRDRMLRAYRMIAESGISIGKQEPSIEEKLMQFRNESLDRWSALVSETDEDDTARLDHGYFAVTFSLQGVSLPDTLGALGRTMDDARQRNYSGYGPFWHGSRKPYLPEYKRTGIEAWMGRPSNDRMRNPFTCSYWRATREGRFFFLEGFYEDRGKHYSMPGTRFDISFSVKRFGEFLLFAAHIGNLLGDDPEVILISEFHGMEDRRLTSKRLWFLESDELDCRIDDDESGILRFTPRQANDNLIELLHQHLHPFYENFSDYGPFDLPRNLVEIEIENLKNRRW